MARTKIRTQGRFPTWEQCPKVMLKAYLEKQKWFIAALGVADLRSDKAGWEVRNGTNVPDKFSGPDPSELEVKMQSDGATVHIVVKMNPEQGFEIRMGYQQEQRRGDGSLVVWYSNNVEGAAERVKRHYEQHGVPWAVGEKERTEKKRMEKARLARNKQDFETRVGTTFVEEKWGNNMVFEQGSFGLTFKYETVKEYEGLPKEMTGKRRVKLSNISGYFTIEEFKEFLAYIGTRPRLVAERLQGKVSEYNPKRNG